MTVPRFGPTELHDGFLTGYPVSGPITSYFGATDDAHFEGHTGVDIAPPKGTPIYAPMGGRVRFTSTHLSPSWWAPVFGNSVILEHDNGWFTLYGHMKNSPEVLAGSVVERGDLLGHVGNTGKVASLSGGDGTHLHWGCAPPGNPWFRRAGELHDPLKYLYYDEENNIEEVKQLLQRALELLGD